MCEYCGCQAVDVIAELTREHDEVVNLIGEVRHANAHGDLEMVIALCGQISAVLGPHTTVEEGGLFPALEPEFPVQVAILEAEHRTIEAVLAAAGDGTARTDHGWPARLTETLSMLRDHILKEQDGVFPAALATLTNEQWDHLGELRKTHNIQSAM